jgi:hypothetical protein
MRLVFTTILLTISSIVSATNYYVKNGGNNTADGKSDANAWATIAKVNASTFSAGDLILFKKGDVWRETLTVPSSGNSGAYIKFTSYGTGTKPRILGSDQATTWTLHSGNVWKATSGSPGNGNVFFVGTDLSVNVGILKTSIANCTAEYNWYYASSTLYIYSPTDPNTRYNSVEVSSRDRGINLNGRQYIEVNGIDMFYQREGGIVEVYPTAGLTGLIVRNCELAYNGQEDGYGYGTHAVYNNSLFEYNTIHHCGRRGIALYNYGSHDMHDIIIQYNTFYYGYHVTGPDIASGSDGMSSGDIYNVTIRNNFLYEPENGPSSYVSMLGVYGRQVGGATSCYNIYIYNNIFKFVDGMGVDIFDDVYDCYIFNNTFYGFTKTSTYQQSFIRSENVPTNNKTYIKNNIFYNDRSSGITYAMSIFLYGSSRTIDVVADYNLYYAPDASKYLAVCWNPNGSWTTSQWASMKSSTGWEALSPTPADPLFVKAPANLQLNTNSPAIGKGINIKMIKVDYNNNYYNNPPSIGAYEGNPGKIPVTSSDEQVIIFYPNPSHEYLTILREGSMLETQSFRIINISGNIVYKDFLEEGVRIAQFPINLKAGIYVVQVLSSNGTAAVHKLIFVNL